ncbi:DUF6278 family protein [Streptomyces sp. NPDC059459]|uniref:DUF6278 family protein n=1 Tax=unclassified Streptomyces TaxID=2593676 RepID=UPI0036B89B52
MNIPFLGRRREGPRVHDTEGIGDLLADCDLLRSQASREGVRLDDSAESLEQLDQVLPRWRTDEEILTWLGNDAGLYLGTVIVRTVPGAVWSIRSDGQPVVRLASGREFDVVASGQAWAADGVPELSQLYGEVAET